MAERFEPLSDPGPPLEQQDEQAAKRREVEARIARGEVTRRPERESSESSPGESRVA